MTPKEQAIYNAVKGFDAPIEDRECLATFDMYERTIAYNWQFALAGAEARKLKEFLESLGCDIEVYLYDPCEEDDEDDDDT